MTSQNYGCSCIFFNLLGPKDKHFGDNFEAATFDWTHAKSLGIVNRCLKGQLDNKKMCCCKILQHAKDQVSSFRERIGVRLCCFKIGVTSNPLVRFPMYLEKGYSEMWLISVSPSIDMTQMLEAALISEFGKHVGCHNKCGSGGEGSFNRDTPPPPPFFVYVTGGRADQSRRVG